MTKIFIKQKHFDEIIAIISRIYPKAVIWAYGSRIEGTAHEGSDLDLVIKDYGEPAGNCSTLKEALRAGNVPFLIDISEFDRLPAVFQTEIIKKHVIFYSG